MSGFAYFFIAKSNSWELQASNVCYGAKNNEYGQFKLKKRGQLKAIRMKHVSGYLDCDSDNPKTNSKSRLGSYPIKTIITDKQKSIVFPDHEMVVKSNYSFLIRGYDARTSEFLTYVDSINPMYVEVGTELRIWFGEDLQDTSEHDNIGKHCVDVYAKISDDF